MAPCVDCHASLPKLLRAGSKSPAMNHIFNVLGFGLIFLIRRAILYSILCGAVIRRANNWLKGCPELAYTPLVLQHASHRIDKRARVSFSVVS